MLTFAAQHGMEDFYAEKYLDTLRVGAGTEPGELFDKSHGFYIAVIQGFFRDYYYTRMEDFYAEKYLDTLRVGAGTEPGELFDKSHGFYIAVIQGFFRDYYYTRGSAFSFLVGQKAEYARYFTPWDQVTPTAFPNPAENRIIENYCSGVYLSPNQVAQLLRNMEQDPQARAELEPGGKPDH